MFKEWLTANESMDVYVSDYDYTSKLDDVEDLSYMLKRKVFLPIWDKMSEEEQQAIRDNNSMSHGVITPDGQFYHDGSTMINFYIGGFEPDNAEKAIKGIKYYLDELGVKYGPFRKEKSRMFSTNVIRIPILHMKPTPNTPPLINLSNANAHLIFGEILGYRSPDGNSYSEIDPRDLLFRIGKFSKNHMDIHAREPYMSKKPGGATMYTGGLSSDAIDTRLSQIEKIAQWAIKNGHNEIYVI